MNAEQQTASGPRDTRLLRVGLIGFGKMGRHHLRAIAASELGTVVGVADPAASQEELAPLLPPGAIIVGSADELFARARPDVVHIVTPPATHVDLAMQAIRSGCHVYVEKPFTLTSADASRVLAFAAERGVRVCAGHQVLFERPALALKEHLPEIGRVVQVQSYFSFNMVRRTITAVDQVKDILPHAVYPVVDQLRTVVAFAGEPIVVCGVSLDASGEAHALLRLGNVTGVIMVTLNGRPIEQYQNVTGTNGSLRADYIGGFLDRLVGPGTGPGVLLTPFRRALHTVTGTTVGVTRLLLGGSYPGLRTLVRRFYESVRDNSEPPLKPESILETVRLCEEIGAALDDVERTFESRAQLELRDAESALAPTHTDAPLVLVTGGTGLLGKRIAQELRQHGFPVRVVARRLPPFSRRVPGVEYAAGDLARGVDARVMAGVGFVVHAAAETSGGKDEHRRNSIDATRALIEAAVAARARGVVHISSLGVLKTSREMGRALDEKTPVDHATTARGPYVWGKAQSEVLAQRLGVELGIPVRIIRPGPLVDFTAYHPPGRLGREIGPFFAAIGPRRGGLSICDVSTAARVVRSYLADFDAAPLVVNLVEAPPPTRRELLERYRTARPDLRAIWVPAWLLRLLSWPLKLLQRVAFGSTDPVDVAAAFANERYDTALAAQVIAGADRLSPAAAPQPVLAGQRS